MIPTAVRLSRVHFPVTALGPGRRLGVWVQGCTLACTGCLSRDTWADDAGQITAIGDVVAAWCRARTGGATGVTISGGEPSQQAIAVAEMVGRIRMAVPPDADDRAGDDEVDVLLYTGLELDELTEVAPVLVAAVDAVITGRFVITEPTDLVWRGSANQRLVPLTPLGHRRYDPFVDQRSSAPALQFVVHDDRISFIGVPRVGELRLLERRLRDHGVTVEGASWRR